MGTLYLQTDGQERKTIQKILQNRHIQLYHYLYFMMYVDEYCCILMTILSNTKNVTSEKAAFCATFADCKPILPAVRNCTPMRQCTMGDSLINFLQHNS